MRDRDFYELTPAGRARRMRRAAAAALDAYDLDVAELRLVTNEMNGIFRVDAADGERFMLRVSRGGNIGHSTTQVRSETEWLAALARDTRIGVPVPVPNAAGDLVTSVEVPGVPGARDCVLFRWLPGRLLGDDLRPVWVAAYGALAARLHEHGATFRPTAAFGIVSYDRAFPFDEPVALLEPDRPTVATEAQREVFAAGAEVVGTAIDALRRREPPRVIHGDLHRWNVLVEPARGGTARRPDAGHTPTVAAIDFEDLAWGWPVQDLAIALYYVAFEPTYPSVREAFRAGYERVRPWPDATGDEIDTFIAGRAIVLANDVELLEEPEVRARAPMWMERFERRVSAFLER